MSKDSAAASFEFVRRESITSLNIELEEYRHKETGAPHFHLRADDSNNVFMVALRTIPQDSTGVAHILEHTTLCGSERYPVRDPFFMMTRRSLNTFMNAFTSSDWTAYPFASQNRKDFHNLLQVYLDAVFFPRLDEMDFAQEGHRLEFAEAINPDSELVRKGVVFNEMKGAMSSPARSLWQSMSSQLFPTVTYHYNSGGDPANIPDLSYEQLRIFHQVHYHPSNSIFMTYGDIPAEDHQRNFEQYALARFRNQPLNIHVPEERRFQAPKNVEDTYALDAPDITRKTYINLGWLLGKCTDIDTQLAAHLLNLVLLDNSASPLRHALETTELGSAPSPLCGLEDSTLEMVLACGVEGSEPNHAGAVEQLILDVLENIAQEGVDQELLDSALHQLELSQREIGGDHYPYGLQLMLNALSSAVHGGDPAAQLNIDPALERLRLRCREPDFIQTLVRDWLLDNPHRVRLTFRPDAQLDKIRADQEREHLSGIKAALSEEQKQQIIAQAAELQQRQLRQDDPELLPKVGIEDIPADLGIAQGTRRDIGKLPATWYAQGTNGLVYQQLIIGLPDVDEDLKDLLPLFCDCLTEVGSGGRDYLETQALQAAVTGGISANIAVRGTPQDAHKISSFFVLSGKALVRNQEQLGSLMLDTIEDVRFDELPRLRELIAQARFHAEQGVTDHGHSLAMLAASSGLSPSALLAHRWEGLTGIQRLKELDQSFSDGKALEEFADRLQRIGRLLRQGPRQMLVIGEAEHHEQFQETLSRQWRDIPTEETQSFRAPFASRRVQEAWTTSTQVNFCATAYPAVAVEHPDAPALMVLGPFLRNGFLHRAVREQGGAYGGGASYDSNSGSFRFYSYRDPRLSRTLDDFRLSLDWLMNSTHPAHTLEEAILGVVARIDQPASPAGEAKRAFHNQLHGRTPEQRRHFRARILEVTLDDLRHVASTHIREDHVNIAVIGNQETVKNHPELNLTAIAL